MQFLLVLAFLAAISISEYAPHQPVGNGLGRLAVAVLAMAIVPLFAAATSTFISGSLLRDASRKGEIMRWFGRLRHFHSLIWLTAAAVVLQQLGWVQLVRFNWGLDGMVLVDDVLILLPIVLPLILSWAAFYEVERSLHYATSSSPAVPVSRRQYLTLHVRHYLGLLLVPVLLVLAIQDIVNLSSPALPEHVEAWLLLAPVILLVMFFPVALRYIWRTTSVPAGELREGLLRFGERVNFRPGELLVWQTDRMIVNAAVTGFVRPWRYVFFTDALLSQFKYDEIEAVLAHEIGHVRRRHLLARLMLMSLPVVGWLAISASCPTEVARAGTWLVSIGLSAPLQATVLGPLALAIYAGTLFAMHARLLEHDADLFASRACDAEHRLTPTGLARMTAVLEKLADTSGIGRDTRSWLHPTIAQRVSFLHQAAIDPLFGERFERTQRRLHGMLAITLIAGAGYLVMMA